MSPATRRSLVVLTACAVVVMGAQIADGSAVRHERDTVAAEFEALQAESALVRGEAVVLAERAGGLRATSSTYDVLIDAREGFVASLEKADAALSAADGKLETAAERAGILKLQQKVLAERTDVAVVARARADVDEYAGDVTKAVEEYDREQARIAAERAAAASRGYSGGSGGGGGGYSGGASAGGGGGGGAAPVAGGYARVRAALNNVGGGHVRLEEFAGACGGGAAAACASPGVIRFTPGLASWSDGRLHWAMAHELAHTYQFNVWGPLVASSGYASLFGGNIELLANCMAAQRGYGSGNVSCSGAQLQWAGSIWGGVVPG
ncbi:hypothetical protein ACFC3F_04115 [Microbacterium sp. NPDC055910]|uniref:hypothetical protein n=1 Tax=Microbacterium sp. NPDC055910 TaxID=3345659 RepID=UPI0035DBBC12